MGTIRGELAAHLRPCVASVKAQGHLRVWHPDANPTIRFTDQEEQDEEHIPCVYVAVAVVLIGAPIVHDLHFPTHRELPCYDLYASVSMEPLQVLNREEHPGAGTLDDETSATWLELPLYK